MGLKEIEKELEEEIKLHKKQANNKDLQEEVGLAHAFMLSLLEANLKVLKNDKKIKKLRGI